jgi:hypothetical protein
LSPKEPVHRGGLKTPIENANKMGFAFPSAARFLLTWSHYAMVSFLLEGMNFAAALVSWIE